jgi:hypothetical protein
LQDSSKKFVFENIISFYDSIGFRPGDTVDCLGSGNLHEICSIQLPPDKKFGKKRFKIKLDAKMGFSRKLKSWLQKSTADKPDNGVNYFRVTNYIISEREIEKGELTVIVFGIPDVGKHSLEETILNPESRWFIDDDLKKEMNGINIHWIVPADDISQEKLARMENLIGLSLTALGANFLTMTNLASSYRRFGKNLEPKKFDISKHITANSIENISQQKKRVDNKIEIRVTWESHSGVPADIDAYLRVFDDDEFISPYDRVGSCAELFKDFESAKLAKGVLNGFETVILDSHCDLNAIQLWLHNFKIAHDKPMKVLGQVLVVDTSANQQKLIPFKILSCSGIGDFQERAKLKSWIKIDLSQGWQK